MDLHELPDNWVVFVTFVLTIDPSYDACTADVLSLKCVRRVCASHPHDSGAVISIHSAESC